MDVVYIGGLAIFAALTVALIAGCERLSQIRQVTAHGVQPAAVIKNPTAQCVEGERP